MPAGAEARGTGNFSGLQPDFVAERLVEADEGAARARGRTGASQVQRPRIPRVARELPRRADCGGTISREVAPSRWLEGHAVQYHVRRHVQRAAAIARAPVRMAPSRLLPQMMPLTLIKAHAFGNDFILVEARAVKGAPDLPRLARAICARHSGVGADGLIVYRATPGGASMRLLNADGSRSEVSGNGVRCLGAWIASQRGVAMPGQQA